MSMLVRRPKRVKKRKKKGGNTERGKKSSKAATIKGGSIKGNASDSGRRNSHRVEGSSFRVESESKRVRIKDLEVQDVALKVAQG